MLQVQRFEEGQKQRFFADDDKQELRDLVAQQRYEGAADMDANLADNILRKGKRFRYGPCRVWHLGFQQSNKSVFTLTSREHSYLLWL